MVLSDRTIRELIGGGRIRIDPFEERYIQPSSVDVRLGRKIRTFKNSHRHAVVDVKQPTEALTELIEIDSEQPFILHPGEFVLGLTLERVAIPDDLVARIEGKSSLGRLGLMIHSTAGFIDPGWDGHITLELANILSLPITLYAGMPIAQVSFMSMTTPVENPYGSARIGSKYQGDVGPTPSKYYLNFEPNPHETNGRH